MTRTDQVIGSPGFMSPEQADGREVGPASDVFSLGSALAFAATGQGPFGTGPATALLYRVVHSPPATGGLPPQLRPLIERCLAKDPGRRPTTGQILAELGAPQLAADWLPPAIAQALLGYELADKAAGQGARTPTRAAVADRLSAGPATASAAGHDHASLADTLGGDAPGAGQLPPMRHRRWVWAWAVGAVALVLGIAATAVALTYRPSGGVPQQSASTQADHATLSASRPVAGPRAVVEDFFAAINARNWPRVWQLGGKNFGYTYPAFVAGFHQTARDVVTHLTTHGSSVSVRFLAHETTGAVQTYQAQYTVHHGQITSGQQTLLATSPPASAAPAVVLMCGTSFAMTGRTCGQAQMVAMPASYGLSADGSGFLTGLTWQGWGQPTAVATGKMEIDNCVPDCAQGTYRHYPATVTVTGLKTAASESYYTVMYVNAPAYGPASTYQLPGP